MADDESSVRVAVRIRPQIPREVIEMCRVCTSVTPGEPQITLSADRSFTFDYVFDLPDDQLTVYDTCVKQLVDGALEGYNATVLAYGQTGSGKTYTMGTGFEVETADVQLGILPRAITHLYAGIRERVQNARHNDEPSPEFKVSAQFMELYNDDIIDLLDQGFIARAKSLKIHEDPDGGISVKGITQQPVTSSAEALNLLRQGALSRTTGATQMNSQSSRSHAIFTLLIKQQRLVKIEDGDNEDSGKSEFATLSAKFHFVDLAGSERLKRTQATGERAREGININAGLFALGNVISALGDKSKKAIHVPYRDSKLTRLLQDSLGGNSQTVMIACISPSDSDFMETLNTLNYANRARNIKNKVMVNQDKSSRTIALLRQQIQDLQVQLLEYQQGKRLVSSDGVEVVNDMCHENMLLEVEANNMRTRLKALQETVDVLSKKNSELLAEKATGAWMSDGDGKDVKEFIVEYLQQIEELRAKLLESEATSQQLRKALSRAPGIVLSPTDISSLSLQTPAPRTPMSENTVPPSLFKTPGHTLSYSGTSDLIAEARMDLSKDLEQLAKREKREKNGNDEDAEDSDSDAAEDEDSDSESSDTDDKQSQYGLEIAEISNEISIKQKLILELELSQKRMHSMKQHYEDKLVQLQNRIKATQDERDKVLASLNTSQNMTSNDDKVRKVREEFERKLSEMQRDVRRLESARKEHARLVKEQNQQNTQLRSLRTEVDEMKRIKVSLMRKMKEESVKHKQNELRHTREIAALRKESRQRENQIRSLQAENRVKEAVLRRRAEEVSVLRSRPVPGLSAAAAGRVKRRQNNAFSPKLAKTHWSKLENNITKVKVNKKAVVLVERDMERLMNERESVGKELEQLIKKRDQLRLSPYSRTNEIRDLQDRIDSAQATLSYIQENISDCQRNIIQMEGTKEDGDSFELEGLLSQVMTLDEGKYLIEKLYNAITAQALAQVQTELSAETLNAKVVQLTSDNDTQNQLLQHLIRETGRDNELSLPGNSASGSSSTSSTRSNSPTLSMQSSSTRVLTEKKSNSSSDSLIKNRRITALPKDLLYVSVSSSMQAKELEDETSPAHSVNNPFSFRIPVVKPTELPQPLVSRKPNESVSPRLPRRASNMSSSKLDLEMTDSPPGSPLTYRRLNSREENVFSRLTGGTQGAEADAGRGTIHSYNGKMNPKAPLICAHVASGHSRAVLSVAATDDHLFTGSKDRSVKVWDLHSGVELQTLGGHPNNVDVVKFCPISRLLFSVSSSYVKVWDLRESPSQCVKTLCSSGQSLHGPILPTTPARVLSVPPGESQLNDIAVNPSGRMLYTAAGDKVRVWDIRKFSPTGKLAAGHQAAVMCLAVAKLSEAEDCVVTGSKDHYIKVFEVAGETSGVFLPKMTLDPPHYDGIQTLALQDNILFSGSRDMCIKKWDLSKQELVQSINNAHANWICGLEMLPGGERFVSGCRSGVLKVWATESCSLLGEVKAHASTINSVAVNSTHLFTASNDNSVRFWKPQLSRLLPEKTSPVKERTSPSLTSSIGRSGRSAWVS